MRELMLTLGIKARQTIYNKLREDQTFPKPRRMGPNTVAWVRAEVMRWIDALPSAELNGLDAIERRGGPSRGERGRKAMAV
jgi:predicted DNA-binding transcriptional regulator AlpA